MKKGKKDGKAKKAESRKGTCIEYLRELYSEDPNVSNESALRKLHAKFPDSNADTKAIVTWKNMLRNEGIDIPKGRPGPAEAVVSKKDKGLKSGKKLKHKKS